MSRFVVRVTGPAGHSTYVTENFVLGTGPTESDDQGQAYAFCNEVNAWAASEVYRQRHQRYNIVCDVVDLDDPEATVPCDSSPATGERL